MNINKAIIVGNLTRDPETRTTPSGQSVTSFSVATNRMWTDKTSGERKKQTEYHNVVVWGKLGEIAQQFLKKGGIVYVEGRLQTRNWQDQQGIKHFRTEIVAEKIEFGPRHGVDGTKEIPSSEEEPSIDEEKDSSDEIDVEEIPF